MRNVLLTLFLALAVFFGSTHADAFTHDHRDAHAGSTLSTAHADDHDSSSKEDSDAPGQDVAHSHVAMDAAPDSRTADNHLRTAAAKLAIGDAMALASLGIAPPLEPPSA